MQAWASPGSAAPLHPGREAPYLSVSVRNSPHTTETEHPSSARNPLLVNSHSPPSG